MKNKIEVNAVINANPSKVWDYYTNPRHIVNWNFADPSWCCPSAENDMQVGGTYKARMEARDGSFGFDFEAIYDAIDMGKSFSYGMSGRGVEVVFIPADDDTKVVVSFDPELENPIDMQKAGWQAILNNFKSYVETN